jgi:hypothetical protein
MLAGHETVSKTVSRPNALSHGMTSDNPRFAADIALWELARRPEIQHRLREEVTKTYKMIRARGKEDFTPGDIDNMSYTNAVVKVSQLNSQNRVLTDI